MAIDEALMITMSSIEVTPVIRLYGFSPATLSLGRLQRSKESILWDSIKKDGVNVVRRPTGGQAVLHDQEVTYSVTLSRDYFQPFKKRLLYESIGTLLLHVLYDLGISGSLNQSRIGELRNPDCFQTSGQYEILSSGGKKLIGSAQVTNRKSCLQHGSLPLNNSYRRISSYLTSPLVLDDKRSTSIEEEIGFFIDFAEVQKRFADSLRNQIECEDSDLVEEEMNIAQELYQQKYSTETWNYRH